MDEASIRSLLDEFGQAWNDHDLDALLALTTDDVVFESTGPAPDGVRAASAPWRRPCCVGADLR